jgi:transcriptional regulator of acetoin/glycerol metabolism
MFSSLHEAPRNVCVSAAAKALGVSRATLHQKLKGFDLKAH